VTLPVPVRFVSASPATITFTTNGTVTTGAATISLQNTVNSTRPTGGRWISTRWSGDQYLQSGGALGGGGKPCEQPHRGRSRRAEIAAKERGFSLIEVTIAMGLLATVLISIASLFIMGGKQVKNGKSTTTAVALTHEIMERIDQLSYSQVYTWFGGTDSSTSSPCPPPPSAPGEPVAGGDRRQARGPGVRTIAVTP